MSIKDTLRKAAGLLVELPPEEEAPTEPAARAAADGADLDQRLAELNKEMDRLSGGTTSAGAPVPVATKTVEQIVKDSPGPNLDEVKVSASQPSSVLRSDGSVDFAALYKKSNIPDAAFSAEQMLDMLSSLPAELPLETKRATVKATLSSMGKAIGATPESIVADTSRKLAALAAYEQNVAKQAADFVAKSQMEIATFQKQIEEKGKAIQTAQQKQSQITSLCEAESHRLDDVLEFFSLDVAPSKLADGAQSPKPQ